MGDSCLEQDFNFIQISNPFIINKKIHNFKMRAVYNRNHPLKLFRLKAKDCDLNYLEIQKPPGVLSGRPRGKNIEDAALSMMEKMPEAVTEMAKTISKFP